ncbi:MAG: bi-domain-containing oxidoreductase [Chthonomonadales bacterium]|nr:bi-domain-containing oxidoreductase [Chthonomonadales bacterium]
MKQILQNLGSGETLLADVPCPGARPGHLLVRSRASVVSIGTERMLIDFGKASLLDKARQQPEKVRQVIEKVRTDGLRPTLQAVRAKLDQPIPLGYSNAGVVLEVGAGVEGFAVGDRVASNGPHAEVVCVPRNLCARIPVGVADDAAAFAVVGAIGLQGSRLAAPTLGESVAVVGLGLIGLLCVQIVRAHGCRVLGVDFDAGRCALARELGAESVDLSAGVDPVSAATTFTRGRGMDAVLLTVATKSSDPVRQAALMSRKRGRIVLIGVVGLELNRADFYEKELSFQVSCSYGPGRYDPAYEQGGHDYPYGFVRWTEQRNIEAVLDLMERGALDTAPLVTHRFPFDRALEAYGRVGAGGALGVVLEHPQAGPDPACTARARSVAVTAPARRPRAPRAAAGAAVGVIGAGGFTTQVLLPALKETGASLRVIASSTGVSAAHAARKFGFERCTTEVEAVLGDGGVDLVLVTTRHDTHARFVRATLEAGKNVYVEKPMCLTPDELADLEGARASHPGPLVAVGFNRRFAPLAVRMRDMLAAVREPKTLIMTVNAGAIPPEHWTQDPAVGGGRVVGEGCHFVDLLRFLVGAPIAGVQAATVGCQAGPLRDDRATFTIRFEDGSLGTVHYFANGSKAFPKERLEAFCAGRVLQIDNYRALAGYGWPRFRGARLRSQDKGHRAEMAALVAAVAGGRPWPTPFAEAAEVTRATFEIARAARASWADD